MRKSTKLFVKLFSLVLVVALSFSVSVTSLSVTAGAAASDYVSKYRSDATDRKDALVRADAINQKIVEEGAVLLKNEGETLPLAPGKKISVFGKNSIKPFYNGGGSSSGDDNGGGGGVKSYTFISGLENAGFIVNPDLITFYNDDRASGSGRDGSGTTGQVATRTGETPVSSYSASLKASFANYNDAAIVFIARAGGEGADLRTSYTAGTTGRSNVRTGNDPTTGDHYLELDDNEEDMIAMVKQNFSKVIVLLNMGTSFELGDLKDDKDIDSIMWIGYPGGSGFNAIGKVLNGEYSPSGRLADIYAKDFKADPTFFNFANNYTSTYSGSAAQVSFVEYDEGIYLGYRYYETRGFVEDDDCAWYNDSVVYPFGYGISYTTFSRSAKFITTELTADGTIEADVTVTNTGDYPGKDVLEMYYTAPYIDGEIEKAHVVLGAFEKTDTLQPGESQTIRVSMSVRRMASYDFNDANGNDFKGYELDKGEYTIYIGSDSHCWAEADALTKTYELEDGITYDTDEKTGNKVENRFDYVSVYFDENSNSVWGGHSRVMSRSDFEGTFPQPITSAQRATTQAEANTYSAFNGSVTASYDQGQPWYTDQMPTMNDSRRSTNPISATSLVGRPYNNRQWEAFMNQLTFNEMAGLVMHGYFTTDAIADLDVPQSVTPDGPTGFVKGSSNNQVRHTCTYASPIVVSSTWNKKLARMMGEAVGDESIWGGDFPREGNGTNEQAGNPGGYNGWYAPGNNTHRSPFSGRNFEYYSEDPVLAGDICANVTGGAQSKGVFVMMKHFALNDQEYSRGNLATWANEQTMREIYLKSFEIAIKDGNATGIMSGFNRIGYAWTGFSYSLLTEVLRNEWGFNGIVITDWVNGFMKADFMVRAGNDCWLANGNVNSLNSAAQQANPTHVAAVRRAAKSVLYAAINSNAMNRLGARYFREHYQGTNYEVALGEKDKGASVSYNAASNIYTGYKYVLSGAPNGITINENTGAISGTIANDAVAGKYEMTVSLKDDNGFIGQAINITLTVNGDGISYVGENNVKLVTGKFARIDVRSEIKGKVVSYALASGSTLPAGMALSADGYIIGVPATSGTVTAQVVASASGSASVTTPVVFTAAEEVKIAYEGEELTAGKAGEAYTADLKKATGSDAITYTVDGELPAGLTLENGVLSGTPTEAGNYTIKVVASAEGCTSATAEFTLVIEEETVVPPDNQSGSSESGNTSSGSGNTSSESGNSSSAAPAPEKKGCFGAIGLGGSLGIMMVLGATAFVFKKKETRD